MTPLNGSLRSTTFDSTQKKPSTDTSRLSSSIKKLGLGDIHSKIASKPHSGLLLSKSCIPLLTDSQRKPRSKPISAETLKADHAAANLKHNLAHRKFQDKRAKLGKWLHGCFKDALDEPVGNVQKGIDIIDFALPSVLNVDVINNRFKPIYMGIELGGIPFKILNFVLAIFAIAHKGITLYGDQRALAKLKAHFKEKSQPLPENILESEKKLTKEWKKFTLETQERFWKLTKSGISCVKAPLKLLPIFENSKLKDSILNGLKYCGTLFDIFDCVTDYLKLKKNFKHVNTYEVLVGKLQAWKQKAVPQVQIDPRLQSLARLNHKLVPQPSILNKLHKITLNNDRNYEFEFFQHMTELENIDKIRDFLYVYNVELSPEIDSKEKFVDHLQDDDFKNQILTIYTTQEEILTKLQNFIDTSKNLLEKREAIIEKKLLQLRPRYQELVPDLQKLRKPGFDRALNLIIEIILKTPISTIQAERLLLSDNLPPGMTKEALLTKSQADILELGLELPPGMDNKAIERIQGEILELGLALPVELNTEQKVIAYLIDFQKNEKERNVLFNNWFDRLSQDSLLKTYIDHQETLESLTRNTIKVMVEKKLKIEEKFINFNWYESITELLFSFVETVSTVFALMFVLNKVSKGESLYKFITFLPFFSKIGFMLVGNYMKFQHRKNATFSLKAYYEEGMLIFNKFMLSHEKLKSFSGKDNQQRMKEREEKVDDYKNRLFDKTWKDFTNSAYPDINATFDLLKALETTMLNSDFTMFDAETKIFFKEQLRINLDALQDEKKKDPDAVKRSLQEYFRLQDDKLMAFIDEQVTDS